MSVQLKFLTLRKLSSEVSRSSGGSNEVLESSGSSNEGSGSSNEVPGSSGKISDHEKVSSKVSTSSGEVLYTLVGESSQAEDMDEDCDDDLGPNLPNETLASVEALNSTIPSSLTKHTAMMKLSLRIQK